MAIKLPTDQPYDEPPLPPHRSPADRGYFGYLIAVAVAAIVAIVVLLIFLANRSSDGDGAGTTSLGDSTVETLVGDAGSSTTLDGTDGSVALSTTGVQASSTTTTQSATTAPAGGTTSSPETTAPGQTGQPVVWPAPGSGTDYPTPAAAALGFARDFIGFEDPVVGEFRDGDARSGEIELRPNDNGPVMTVAVRQVGSGNSWSVIAVSSENILIERPGAGDVLANPAILEGKARAFEGHVDVQLYANGQAEPVAVGFVTGRGDGVLGAFSDELDWPAATRGDGVLVMLVSSAEDGSPWDVAAVPVRFAP